MLLLVIFVFGSLAFSMWAWRSYDAASRAKEEGKDDPAALIIPIVITFLGSFLFELLRHRTGWSFTLRIGLLVATMVLAQYLASRFSKRVRPKGSDGPEARHHTSTP